MLTTKVKYIKNTIFYIFIIITIFIIFITLYKKCFFSKFYNAIIGNKAVENIVDNVIINGNYLAFNEKTNTFYYPISLVNENKEIKLDIKVDSDKFIKSSINNNKFFKSISIKKVLNYNEKIELDVESILEKNVYYIEIINLPTVSLYVDETKINVSTNTYSKIVVNDISSNSEQSIIRDAKIRYRGGTSLYFKKKPYRIRIDNGNNSYDSILGLGSNNIWILSPMITDQTKIREKLSSDLWNEINKDITSYEYNKLSSRYVLLYINNEYKGIYLFKGQVNEISLNLEKNSENKGVLIKGIGYDPLYNNSDDLENIDTYIYKNTFELKYPEDSTDINKYWSIILNKYKNIYLTNYSESVFENDLYIDNITNYIIFTRIIGGFDNYSTKNLYFYLKNTNEDTKAVICPWDLDLTFGLNYVESIKGFTEQYDNYNYLIDFKSFKKNNNEYFIKKLKERWNEMKDDVLSPDSVSKRIDAINNYIYTCKIVSENKDIDKEEIEKIKNWYYKRYNEISRVMDSL